MNINGPALDKLEQRLLKRAQDYIQTMYKNMTDQYPYGSVRLNNFEQWNRFTQMQPQDLEMMISMLNEKYRGMPNAYDLVNRDLSDFLAHMMTLAITYDQAVR